MGEKDTLPVIHSIVRVNPDDYQPDDVMLRSDMCEVELFDPTEENDATETWIVDELADRNDVQDRNEILFSSQSDIHASFNHWMNESVYLKADALTCVVLGGRGAGKSYTLFGKDSVEERGIIPRYVQSLYEVDVTEVKEKGTAYHFNSKLKNLLLSMYMVHGDTIIDLLNPPHEYPVEGNLGYFDTFGATPLSIKVCHSDTEEHTLHLLHLGILTASMVALNTSFLFNCVDIYVNFKLFYPNKVQTVTFIEASSLSMLHSAAIESTDFPKLCPEMRTAEAFKQSGLFGPAAVDKSKLVNKKSGFESSFMTYMLQDALTLNGYRADSTYLTSTLLLGCLRGSADCFSDNKVTLDAILSITEKQKEMLNKYLSKPHDIHVYRQRLTHQISVLKLTDELVTVRNMIEKELKNKIPVIQKGDKMHTPRTELLMKYEKRKKQLTLEFYAKKVQFLDMVLKHITAKKMKKKEKRHDIREIKTWLRSRGLFGLQIQAEPDLDDPEYKIQALMAGVSLEDDDDRHETVEYPIIPWSTDGVPMSEAYFMPITPLNFPSAFLFLGLPSGHLAVGHAPLHRYVEEVGTGELRAVEGPPPKFQLDGIKHCKVLPLDSILLNEKHCIIFRLGTSVKIRPLFCEDENEMSLVEVNSVVVDEETILQDGDVLRLGATLVFVLKIPAESDADSRKTLSRKSSSNLDTYSEYGDEDEDGEGLNRIITVPMEEVVVGNYDPCLCAGLQTLLLQVISDCLSSNLMKAHLTVDRELVDITHEEYMTDEMLIESYLPTNEELIECCNTMSIAHKAALSEAVLATLYANYWATRMQRDMNFTAHLRKKYTYDRKVARQYRGIQHGVVVNGELYDIKIHAECLFKGQRSSRGDSWWWSITEFMRRIFHIRMMYHDFMWKYSGNIDIIDERYKGADNPFLQPTVPELIGVANIHMDNIFYLFDTRQCVPVISFKGNHAGTLTFKLRCWIDKVEALPDYLKLDNFAKFSDFMGRKSVLRFHFESLNDINRNLSNNIQITYNFFCHSGQYKTTRLPARDQVKGDTVAYIDNSVMIVQPITMDYIRYATRRSIELEIWGSRLPYYFQSDESVDGDDVKDEADVPVFEFKVGELSAVRNLKLPDLGSNAKGKMDSFERVKAEALGAIEEDSDDDVCELEQQDAFDDLASTDSMSLAMIDTTDPEEIKKQIKDVSSKLVEAEKNYRRAAKTAESYKIQVTKLNPTGATTKRKFSNVQVRPNGPKLTKVLDKDLQISLMEKELAALKEEVNNKKSKACIIS